MEKVHLSTYRPFLVSISIIYAFIGLFLIISPSYSSVFLNFTTRVANEAHFIRGFGMMCIFLAVFWSWSSLKSSYVFGGLLSCIFVLLGNVFGNFLSLLIDGFPQWNLLAGMFIQFAFALIGIYLIRHEKPQKVKNMV
jgi:hypothetical protein